MTSYNWKYFPRYWPFVWGIHRSPVNSTHKGQWRGALMFSLIYAWIHGWVNNREAGDLRCHRVHYDVTLMRQLQYYKSNAVGTMYATFGVYCTCKCWLYVYAYVISLFQSLSLLLDVVWLLLSLLSIYHCLNSATFSLYIYVYICITIFPYFMH